MAPYNLKCCCGSNKSDKIDNCWLTVGHWIHGIDLAGRWSGAESHQRWLALNAELNEVPFTVNFVSVELGQNLSVRRNSHFVFTPGNIISNSLITLVDL